MKNTILEAQKSLDVLSRFETVIVGAGIAGVAAALAAARQGKRVCLIEKTCSPGGLATLANVVMYLPLCDGEGRQVSDAEQHEGKGTHQIRAE
jgi:glycine/D-amino acid oxidase-like deaminating enzyme